MRHGRVLTELLKQDKNRPIATEEQVILLYFFREKKLDSLDAAAVAVFKDRLASRVHQANPGLLKKLKEEKKLSAEIREELNQLVAKAATEGWL